MGLIKEYVDRAVQTVPSPYADPAVVLAAPLVARPTSPYVVPPSPTTPVRAPLVSRRPSKRRNPRSAAESVNRRIASMPETKAPMSQGHSTRVVSMPDRLRPELEPSAELFESTSTAAPDSFSSYSGRHERVRVFRAPSDVPQTPSPPSSPESLLIIAAGTQLSDGFLRRKYSPEPLIEEDEDWITWANSPPRPIPALHGPLSLPYARCPSGAEGTIIEEPDSVAQMIWGLGPDDQPHNQNRAESLHSHSDDAQSLPSRGPSQVPPRLQKKKTVPVHQAHKSSRTSSVHSNHGKPNLPRTRQSHDEKRSSQVPSDMEPHQDVVNGISWSEGQSIPATAGLPDDLASDTDMIPGILEWQLARLRRALRTSLANMDSHSAYPGRLEPVIPADLSPGLPQSYPRIFVEPRPNDSVNSITRQSPIEIAQQYRQQHLFRQALQKQKLQVQSILPTPPNSSSPQWSSHFSPYLAYGSTLSPELVGSTEHTSSQKHRSGTTSQYLRHFYDGPVRERDGANNFATNTSPIRTPQNVSNIHSAASFRQDSASSSTLAKYIKQLQALSPIAHLSPLQSDPPPPPGVSSSKLPSNDNNTAGSIQSVYHSASSLTPPLESPKILPRGSLYHNARSMPPTHPVQRRLSAVPEEDSVLLELSTSISPSMLQNYVSNDSISAGHHASMGRQACYLEVPLVDAMRKSAISDLPELENNLGTLSTSLYHETSPVKVRLPTTKENNIRLGEQNGGHLELNKDGHQHGHRKRQRYKKFKGPTTSEQAPQGLVG